MAIDYKEFLIKELKRGSISDNAVRDLLTRVGRQDLIVLLSRADKSNRAKLIAELEAPDEVPTKLETGRGRTGMDRPGRKAPPSATGVNAPEGQDRNDGNAVPSGDDNGVKG